VLSATGHPLRNSLNAYLVLVVTNLTRVDAFAAKSALGALIMTGILGSVSVVPTTSTLALMASVLTVQLIAHLVRTQPQELVATAVIKAARLTLNL
jgi:hypothetical protein